VFEPGFVKYFVSNFFLFSLYRDYQVFNLQREKFN
jgi:hypothetical protein